MLKNKEIQSKFYYTSSIIIFVLALIYCYLVYVSNNYDGAQYGYYFLLGIPNYYIFYLTIFPFVTAGVAYIATCNSNIRFFGSLNEKLDIKSRHKVTRLRKIFFLIAIVFSLGVAVKDASDKGRVLPPYSMNLISDQAYVESINKYISIKKEIKKENKKENRDYANEYFQYVKDLGFEGKSISGFSSIDSWLKHSSNIYKLETFLSWIAALVISLFVSQIFLLVYIIGNVPIETKNLILWILILCTLWIPTKIFSVHYYAFIYDPPGIIWLAIFLAIIGILLSLFIRVGKNDVIKYAGYLGALFTSAATLISIFKPEYFNAAISVVEKLGFVFGGILLFVLTFSIFLVTDKLINSYEEYTQKSTN